MNRLGTLASDFVRSVGAAFTWAGGKVAGGVSLTNSWLAHLLWLIEATFRELATHAFKGNAAVYACVRFLCTSVAEPPLVAYWRNADGDPDGKLPWSHPLRQVLRKPNPFLTEMEHYELITMHLCIAGRYTGWKERDNYGRVKAIWPIRPDRLGPIYGDMAAGEDLLIGWSYQVPGTTIYLGIPHDDIILINLPDPVGESGGMVEGLGPLQALANEIGADNAATLFVGALVANYAQPGIVIQTKGAVQREEDQLLIKAGFKRDFGGAKRGEPAVIDSDTTVTQIGFSLQQLEFKSLRDVSESRIAAALGVPAVLVGLLVGLQSGSGLGDKTDELRAFFATQTLPVYWRRYAEAMTNDLAIEYGDNIICAYDLTKVAALAEQSDARYARMHDAFTANAMTINQYRKEIGLEEWPVGGDVCMNGLKPGEKAAPVPDAFGLTALSSGDKPTNGNGSNGNGKQVDPTASTDSANGKAASGNPVKNASPAEKEQLKAARAALLEPPQSEASRGVDEMERGLEQMLAFWDEEQANT